MRDRSERFWSYVDRRGPDECWPWIGCINTTGYGAFSGRPSRVKGAHQWAWMLTNGPIPDGMFVLHRCDVRECVNPAHLFVGSHADNMHDMIAKGRANHSVVMRGEEHGAAKLTRDDVREIRQLTERGVRGSVLARRYGVSHTLIIRIAKRYVWRHVA